MFLILMFLPPDPFDKTDLMSIQLNLYFKPTFKSLFRLIRVPDFLINYRYHKSRSDPGHSSKHWSKAWITKFYRKWIKKLVNSICLDLISSFQCFFCPLLLLPVPVIWSSRDIPLHRCWPACLGLGHQYQRLKAWVESVWAGSQHPFHVAE